MMLATPGTAISPRIIPDEAGTAAFLAAPLPSRRTYLDVLSGEEIALSGGALLQARIDQSSSETTRVTGKIVNAFLGDEGLRPGGQLQFFNKTGFSLPTSSAPVLSLYYNNRTKAFATLISTAIGFSRSNALVYRGRNGAIQAYDLRSSDNLFGCIQLARMPRTACRMRQLRRYGIITADQMHSFTKVQETDAWVVVLWMLVRRHEPTAEFPTRECRKGETRDCVSWEAFKKRSHTVIPTD
ncbi:MAG: hypothetical protein JOZ58_27165 [Acetobacteraceae bacterium]|nr:hypothetical protein [Acetobacteraceae bacterium]